MRRCMLSTFHGLICSIPGGWENSKNKEIPKNMSGLMWENTTHARISSQWRADEYWRVYTSRGTRTPGSSSRFHFLVIWMPYLLFYHQDVLPWQTVKSNTAKYYEKNPPNLWAKINLLLHNLVIQGIYYNDIKLAQKRKT